MENIKISVDELTVTIEKYGRLIEMTFATTFELDTFLLQLVFSKQEEIDE